MEFFNNDRKVVATIINEIKNKYKVIKNKRWMKK